MFGFPLANKPSKLSQVLRESRYNLSGFVLYIGSKEVAVHNYMLDRYPQHVLAWWNLAFQQ